MGFVVAVALFLSIYLNCSYADAEECSTCNCQAVEILADGPINEAIEYNDTAKYGVTIPSTKGYEFWENILFEAQKGDFNFDLYKEQLKAVDLHSSLTKNFWERYSKFKKSTNLNYKDLLGTYTLVDSCSKDWRGNASPVYKKVLSDGTEAYLYKAKIGPHWQVGPYVHSATDREFKWSQIIERATDEIDENGNHARGNDTNINIVLKSEAWLNGFCFGNCVSNCTGSQTGEPVWSYMQKQVNPVKEDLRVEDTSIRVMCKDDYDKLMKRMPPCTTNSGKVKDKSCKFPFKFKEKEYNECTLDGTKEKGPEWCATSVARDRTYVKGSWGNCDQESCKAIPNDGEGICPNGTEWVKHKRRCYGFFVNNQDRLTWRKAQEKCRSFVGGDLVSIFTKAENEFIAQKVVEINPDLNGPQQYYPWIGLEIRPCRGKACDRTKQCPKCKWSDTEKYQEKKRIFNPWNPHEPSVKKGRGPPARATLAKDDPVEKCIHIYPGGEWNNAFCKQQRGYICSGPRPEKVDFCASKPCKNGGKCDINIDENGFDCFCKGRYRGKTCEIGVTFVAPVCTTKSTTTAAPLGGAVPRNAECEDASDCLENGIVDDISCDFAPWAVEKCPKTCNTCGLKVRSDDSDEQELDDEGCTPPVTKITAVDTVSKTNKEETCVDAPDCAETGIIDPVACDFTPWAYDRCPATCGECTLSSRSDTVEEPGTLLQTTKKRPKNQPTKKRKKQKKSKCTGNYCDESYWDTKTKKELINDPKKYHTDTEAADYLPNVFDKSCGDSSKFGHIVGGQDSKIGEFPFVAAMGFLTKKGTLMYTCGGSLINRRYVVTAAHCFMDKKRTFAEVVIGDHNLASNPDCDKDARGNLRCTNKPVQRFQMIQDDVIIHDSWDLAKLKEGANDIALIRLPKLVYTMYEVPDGVPVSPVCLPWGDLSNGKLADYPAEDGSDGLEYIALGWGRTNNAVRDRGDTSEGGAHSNILQKLELPFIPIQECKHTKDRAGNEPYATLTNDKQVCAGGRRGKDTCQGDSGGPLMVREGEESPMYLKGVLSFGSGKCGIKYPAVFTNVKSYIPWLKEHMHKQDFFGFGQVASEIISTTAKPNRKPSKKRKNQIETHCTGPYCDEEYWDTHTKRELEQLESFVGHNADTEAGNYLPNEFEGTCGSDSKTGHIFGGENAKIGEFPFIAALGFKNKRNRVFYDCGGSLINRNYVITAAHCFDGDALERFSEVVLGDHNLATNPDCIKVNGEQQCTNKPVQRFYMTGGDAKVHENWDRVKLKENGNDIALVRLPKPAYTMFEIGSGVHVSPVCLPWGKLPDGQIAKYPTGPQSDNEHWAVGWGRTNNIKRSQGDRQQGGAFINILQKLKLPIVPPEPCRTWGEDKGIKESPFRTIATDKYLCAGGRKRKDTCPGDSGGPLMVRQGGEGFMYLKGLVSFGTSKCGLGYPGIYTNISYYIPWIIQNLEL